MLENISNLIGKNSLKFMYDLFCVPETRVFEGTITVIRGLDFNEDLKTTTSSMFTRFARDIEQKVNFQCFDI